MTLFDPIMALALPSGTTVDRRVPKTLLMERGPIARGDRGRIREGMDELRWVATLKPANVGIAEYCDTEREYIEIAVLRLRLRPAAQKERLIELVHRAIPYPVLLVAWRDGLPELSLAHKRVSRADNEKTVLDGDMVTSRLPGQAPSEAVVAYRDALALARQPRRTLKDLYQGWIDTVQSLHAAAINGVFRLPSTRIEALDRQNALRDYWSICQEISYLTSIAGKECQIARRVKLNQTIERLRIDRDAARARL